MMSYLRSFFQKREEEYKAVRRSREIYEEILKKFYTDTQPAASGLCSERNCSGWELHWHDANFVGGSHWVICTHRKRRGLEARKKDMIPQHVHRVEDEIYFWEQYNDGPRLEEERREREVKRQVSLQSKTLREPRQASSTGHKSDKKQ